MKVVFVNMPFAGIRPAIGIALLQARLRADGVDASTVYANMRFAQRIGVAGYDYLAERTPIPSLAGDWVFSATAFGERPDEDSAYRAAFTQRFGAGADEWARLVAARAEAAGFLDDLLAEVDWGTCDVVGFTSTFTQNLASVSLAQRITERHPQVRVVFGGANCEGAMGLALLRNFSCIDYVCCGEADATFPALIDALRTGRPVAGTAGLAYRGADGVARTDRLQPDLVRDLDALPVPDYDDYFTELSTWSAPAPERRGVLMESARGCWWGERHHCTFCGLNGAAMTFRSKSSERVLEEMHSLVARYGPSFIEMVDNILDMQYFRDLLPTLRDLGLPLSLFFEVKANLSKPQVHLLREAGVATIQPGIESFSDDVLARMRKGTTTLQNVQLLKWCKEIGVEAYWNLLYGFPGEDPADYTAMIEVIDAVTHLQPPHAVGAVRLDRFSPYFTDPTLGMRSIRADRSYRLVYALPEVELEGIAYYFEFDYADGREPHGYAHGIRAAVGRWHRDASARLISVDHGTSLAIWDQRSGAARRVTVLEGTARAAYLYCDQHRARRAVEQFFAARGTAGDDAAELIDSWVADRLVLEIGDRVLALAVPRSAVPHPDRAAVGAGYQAF